MKASDYIEYVFVSTMNYRLVSESSFVLHFHLDKRWSVFARFILLASIWASDPIRFSFVQLEVVACRWLEPGMALFLAPTCWRVWSVKSAEYVRENLGVTQYRIWFQIYVAKGSDSDVWWSRLLGSWTSSVICYSKQHNVLETGSVSILTWWETCTLLGPLEGANPNDWSIYISIIGYLCHPLWCLLSLQLCLLSDLIIWIWNNNRYMFFVMRGFITCTVHQV
jgi:hypothetical protein